MDKSGSTSDVYLTTYNKEYVERKVEPLFYQWDRGTKNLIGDECINYLTIDQEKPPTPYEDWDEYYKKVLRMTEVQEKHPGLAKRYFEPNLDSGFLKVSCKSTTYNCDYYKEMDGNVTEKINCDDLPVIRTSPVTTYQMQYRDPCQLSKLIKQSPKIVIPSDHEDIYLGAFERHFESEYEAEYNAFGSSIIKKQLLGKITH